MPLNVLSTSIPAFGIRNGNIWTPVRKRFQNKAFISISCSSIFTYNSSFISSEGLTPQEQNFNLRIKHCDHIEYRNLAFKINNIRSLEPLPFRILQILFQRFPLAGNWYWYCFRWWSMPGPTMSNLPGVKTSWGRLVNEVTRPQYSAPAVWGPPSWTPWIPSTSWGWRRSLSEDGIGSKKTWIWVKW